MEIPNDWAWVGWTLLGLVLVALGICAWLWWQKKRQTAKPPLVAPPHMRAKLKLQLALAHLSDPRAFCFHISEALRVYLEERFHFHAPERTTEEFLAELQGSRRLTPSQKQSLTHFLESCDLVKFAKFEPTEQALRELHNCALRLVDETQFEPVAAAGASTGGLSRPPNPSAGMRPPPVPSPGSRQPAIGNRP